MSSSPEDLSPFLLPKIKLCVWGGGIIWLAVLFCGVAFCIVWIVLIPPFLCFLPLLPASLPFIVTGIINLVVVKV